MAQLFRRYRLFLERFGAAREGGVAIIVAASVFVLVGICALAVDLGSVYLHGRHVQGAADLAALSAARDLPRASAAATATARSNLGNDAVVVTQVGIYSANPSKTVEQRFSPNLVNPNGAKVQVTSRAPLYFAAIFGKTHVNITRKATAAVLASETAAMFSIGSRLVSLENGLLNTLLSRLLGSNVSLSVMDYNRLVDADVNLLEFLNALSVELGLEVGDYDALLSHDVKAGTVLKVLEVVASKDVRSVLSQITGLGLNSTLKVGQLVGAKLSSPDGLKRALDLDVSALDLLVVSLETANGHRQLALNSHLPLPFATTDLMVAIGQKPIDSAWVTAANGPTPIIRTSQTRIFAKVKSADYLDSILGLDVQVFAEAAAAEARIKSINCGSPRSVVVEARPGLLQLTVGKVDNPGALNDFATKINTQKIRLASVAGISLLDVYATVEAKDRTWQTLTFSEADIQARKFKKVRSKEIATSLLKNLTDNLKIDLLGFLPIGWLLGNILSPLTSLLGYILDGLLNPLLDLLGIGLGEADVRVLGMTCPGDRSGIPNLVS